MSSDHSQQSLLESIAPAENVPCAQTRVAPEVASDSAFPSCSTLAVASSSSLKRKRDQKEEEEEGGPELHKKVARTLQSSLLLTHEVMTKDMFCLLATFLSWKDLFCGLRLVSKYTILTNYISPSNRRLPWGKRSVPLTVASFNLLSVKLSVLIPCMQPIGLIGLRPFRYPNVVSLEIARFKGWNYYFFRSFSHICTLNIPFDPVMWTQVVSLLPDTCRNITLRDGYLIGKRFLHLAPVKCDHFTLELPHPYFKQLLDAIPGVNVLLDHLRLAVRDTFTLKSTSYKEWAASDRLVSLPVSSFNRDTVNAAIPYQTCCTPTHTRLLFPDRCDWEELKTAHYDMHTLDYKPQILTKRIALGGDAFLGGEYDDGLHAVFQKSSRLICPHVIILTEEFSLHNCVGTYLERFTSFPWSDAVKLVTVRFRGCHFTRKQIDQMKKHCAKNAVLAAAAVTAMTNRPVFRFQIVRDALHGKLGRICLNARTMTNDEWNRVSENWFVF